MAGTDGAGQRVEEQCFGVEGYCASAPRAQAPRPAGRHGGGGSAASAGCSCLVAVLVLLLVLSLLFGGFQKGTKAGLAPLPAPAGDYQP